MTFTVFLVDPVDTNADSIPDFPTYPGRAVRQVLGALLSGHTAARPLGARTGVTPGTATTTVSVLTTPTVQWSLAPLSGVIDLETAAAAGAYLFSSDAVVTGGIPAADGSHDRIDLLSLQLSDPSEGDGSSVPSVIPIYTQGVAASSPTAPGTPARAVAIAQINVPKATTGDPTATWVAPYLAAAGAIIPCQSSAYFPASPYLGQIIDDQSAGCLRRYNSSGDWVPMIPQSVFRVTRTTTLNIGTSETKVVSYDGTPNSMGDDITFAGGIFTVHRTRPYRWDATVLCPSSTDMVDVYAKVNDVPFASGRARQPLITAHQTYLSPGGVLFLSNGDQVQLALVDLDGSLTVNPLGFSLTGIG